MADSTEMVMHINDTLGAVRRQDVEFILERQKGIYDARFSEKRPHLMVVEYNPGIVSSMEILQQMQGQQLQAERIA